IFSSHLTGRNPIPTHRGDDRPGVGSVPSRSCVGTLCGHSTGQGHLAVRRTFWSCAAQCCTTGVDCCWACRRKSVSRLGGLVSRLGGRRTLVFPSCRMLAYRSCRDSTCFARSPGCCRVGSNVLCCLHLPG